MAKAKKQIKKDESKKSAVVVLKRMPQDGNDKDQLAPQANDILKVLKGKGSKLAVADLIAALKGKLETKQSEARIWTFYRATLIKRGFVAVQK